MEDNFKGMYRALKVHLILALTLVACNPRSQEDFHLEGQAQCRALAEQLQSVNSREELIAHAPVLKKKFHRLTDLIIEARTAQVEGDFTHSGTEVYPEDWSEALRVELRRIYAIEGGKELVEEAQRPSLLRLDQFEREMADKKAKRIRKR